VALRLWPIHPHPLPDELLSSWMIRIAHGNGSKVHNFYAEFFGREKQIWNRDIDHHAPPWLLEALEERTGVRRERIEQTTLRNLESWVFEQFTENGITKGVLPLGVFHRTRRSFGQQFCPLCFREDAQPYLRRSWRLALTVVCVRHGVRMQDRCSSCGYPLAPHRFDFGTRQGIPEKTTMARCHKCGSNLSVSVTPAGPLLIQMQQVINQALQSGYVTLGEHCVYAPQFFEGLRRLMRIVPSEVGVSKRRSIFELTSIIQRTLLLQFAMQLVVNWPCRFLERCREIPHAYTTLSMGGGVIPYWLHSVLRRDVYSGRTDITMDEVMAMVHVVEQQGSLGSVTHQIKKMWGRDIGHLVPREHSVDDDTADMLIAALNQEISGADMQKRNVLVRDKVMFIAARCLKLTPTQLTQLEGANFSTNCGEEFSFVTRIETAEQAYAMLRWYSFKMRPHLASKKESALFVTHRGVAISPNGVGARFVRAVFAADLRHLIPSWEQWIRKHRM
jgi:TniQ